MASRRHFLRKSAAIGSGLAAGSLGIGVSALAGVPLTSDLGSVQQRIQSAPHPLKILILGGTSFLGPHQIAYSLGRGHEVTIFTRGTTKPKIFRSLFQHVEHLIGDRENDLSALEGRKWDAVIDNSGRDTAWTERSAQMLKDNVRYYMYTSSTGVYFPYLGDDITEETKLVLDDGEDPGPDLWYGVMKSTSEIAARNAFGADRTIVVRPTYITGPGDTNDRFPYWPIRIARGGEVMVPGLPDDPIQYIDARDLTQWMIRLIEAQNAGTFNVVGPASRMGMHEFIHGVRATSSAPLSLVSIPDNDFLLEQNVPYIVPWIMPTGDNYGSARASNVHAITNGLTYTPLAQTALDILEWWDSDSVSDERRDKLVHGEDSLMAREKDIIAAWCRKGKE